MIDLNIHRRVESYHSFSLREALKQVERKQGILLHSGKINKENQFHILAWDPLLDIFPDRIVLVETSTSQPLNDFESFLNDLMERNHHRQNPDTRRLFPYTGGPIGYFTYEFKRRLEEIDIYRESPEDLPLAHLRLYHSIRVFDVKNKKCLWIRQSLKTPLPGRWKFFLSKRSLSSSLKKGRPRSRDWYIRQVGRIKHYICRGEIYQANLARMVRGSWRGDKSDLAYSLFKANPAGAECFFRDRDRRIISTSPERLFKLRGRRVSAFPIKGTIARGKNRRQDHLRLSTLRKSPKDLAELAMIVDLLQNDLCRTCLPGSVQVVRFPKAETYRNVHHLVGHIVGKTSNQAFQVFKALFPGGSISGCPKIRACQLLEKIEKQPRELYTGSMGYFSFSGDADFNILIRTLVFDGDAYVYGVGGGITLLSDPDGEWEETRHKEQTLASLLGRKIS